MRSIALWLVVGCGPVVEEVEDGGEVCAPVSFLAEEAPTFTYVEGCMSGSLSEVELRCEVVVEGTVIEVTTSLRYERPRSGEATADCNVHQATCDGPLLADGTYTLRFAGDETAVVVPSSVDPAPCLGGP